MTTTYQPGTQTEKLEKLYELQSDLMRESTTLAATVTSKFVSEWKKAGGCLTCLGHEQVVTWSTLDGPGWTEYGPCKDCTEQSKAAGKMPFSYWAGGYSAAGSGTATLNDMFSMPDFHAEAVLFNTYQLHLEAVRYEIETEEDRLRVGPGKTVVVYKGRKVPKGTTGRCFWIGETRYGMRAGLTTDSGETFWTAKDNLAVVA